MTEQNQADKSIAIIGGGLAGFAAAAAIAKAGFQTIHIAPAAPADRRTSALMETSVALLQQIGLTQDPDTLGTPLANIRIIDATNRLMRAPETLFESTEFGHDQFGWNFTNGDLLEALEELVVQHSGYRRIASPLASLKQAGNQYALTLEDDTTLNADFVVGADGKKSLTRQLAGIQTREEKFNQSALVCDLELQRPIGHTSVEFHYPNGPFTLVPAGDDRANLVWIDNAETLQEACALDKGELEALFAAKSQHLFGKVSTLTPTSVFPLSILHAGTAGQNGIALVGEAVHAFPPIGAQGLNLSLRDVSDLTQCLKAADLTKTDWPKAVSNAYATQRRSDLAQTSTMVGVLFKSLLTDFLPAQTTRASGLWALKLLPALRKKAFSLGMGVR